MVSELVGDFIRLSGCLASRDRLMNRLPLELFAQVLGGTRMDILLLSSSDKLMKDFFEVRQ